VPWIAIPVIIAIVQLVRDAPLDAAVFGVVAVLLALDVTGVLPEVPVARVPLAPLLAVGVVVAVVLVLAPRHGVVATVAVSAVGVAAGVLAWARPPERTTARVADRVRLVRGATVWAVVAVTLCLWELSSFLLGRDDEAAKLAHPAVSDLLDPLIDTWWGRVAFVVLWVVAGSGFIRAGRRA
jgi:hypothetical protein